MSGRLETLGQQEAAGCLDEEIKKIVDGVVEDIRNGHVTYRLQATRHTDTAAQNSIYTRDVGLVRDTVKFASAKSVLEWADRLVRFSAVYELHTRPEYCKLSPTTVDDLIEPDNTAFTDQYAKPEEVRSSLVDLLHEHANNMEYRDVIDLLCSYLTIEELNEIAGKIVEGP